MAYIGNNLSTLVQTVEGTFGIFLYVTSDSMVLVTSAGYLSDGVARGMELGDFCFVVSGGVPFLLYCSNVVGKACTLASVSVALNGNNLPTSNPGVGSGFLWNNGGVVCVA